MRDASRQQSKVGSSEHLGSRVGSGFPRGEGKKGGRRECALTSEQVQGTYMQAALGRQQAARVQTLAPTRTCLHSWPNASSSCPNSTSRLRGTPDAALPLLIRLPALQQLGSGEGQGGREAKGC